MSAIHRTTSEPAAHNSESGESYDRLKRSQTYALNVLPGYPACADDGNDKEEVSSLTDHHDAASEKEEEADARPTFDDLFFDLLFGAALAVYSITVDLSSPGKVGAFIGYFSILWWSWVTQVLFDVRFRLQEGPWYIKLSKTILNLVLLGTWVAFGTTSSEFARASYTNFSRIYALTRITLVVNGILVLINDWLKDRRFHKSPELILLINIAAQIISLLLWLFSPDVTDSYGLNGSLIAIWSASIALEMVAQICTEHFGKLVPLSKTHLTERMALFSLIVFGTGFEGIGTALNNISPGGRNWDQGGVPQGGWGSLTLLNAVSAVAIVLFLFFGYYRKAVTKLAVSPIWTVSWCYGHIILHLASALLVVGLNKLISFNNTYSAVRRFEKHPTYYLPDTADWQTYIDTRIGALFNQTDLPDVSTITDPYDKSVVYILLSILSTQGALIPSVDQATSLIESTQSWTANSFPTAFKIVLQPYYAVIETVQTSDAFSQWINSNLFQYYYVYICAGVYLFADVLLKSIQHKEELFKMDTELITCLSSRLFFAISLALVQLAYIYDKDLSENFILGGLSILAGILLVEIVLQAALPKFVSWLRRRKSGGHLRAH